MFANITTKYTPPTNLSKTRQHFFTQSSIYLQNSARFIVLVFDFDAKKANGT